MIPRIIKKKDQEENEQHGNRRPEIKVLINFDFSTDRPG
jgi:hypothetical protein